jgi:hypothetical protein
MNKLTLVRYLQQFASVSVLASLLLNAQPAGSQTISTVVGNHALGGTYGGDNGAATSAGLNGPTGISFNSHGYLLIADTGNCSIRFVSNSVIRTIPNGSYYFSTLLGVAQDSSGNYYAATGDWGGLPEFQTLPYITAIGTDVQPAMSVTLGSSGNLYCVDEYGNTVSLRTPVTEANPNGTVTTIAGNGSAGYSGDGGPAVDASLYVFQYFNLPSWNFILSSTAVDAHGNVYIADIGNNVIRKVGTNGIINTVAGSNALGAGYSGDSGLAVNAQLYSPTAVAVDPSGNLYIADTGNNVIRKVNTSGVITTVAGTGTAGYSGDGLAATSATLYAPGGLAFDSSWNLFVSDTGNHVIRKLTFSSTISTSSSPSADGTTSGGGTVDNGTSVTVVATPATGYGFLDWTENGTVVSTNASYTFTAAGNRSLVANFVVQYTIATTTSPAGGGTTSGGAVKNNGATITITATPASGYTFVDWTVNDDEGMDDAWDGEQEANGASLYYAGPQEVSTNATYSFTVSSNQTVIAHFSPNCGGTFNLTIGGYYSLDTLQVADPSGNVVWGPIFSDGTFIASSFTAVAGHRYILTGHRNAVPDGVGAVDYYEEFFPFQVDATIDLTGPPYTEQDGSLCQ